MEFILAYMFLEWLVISTQIASSKQPKESNSYSEDLDYHI